MSDKAANFFALMASLALILALTVRWWGPWLDQLGMDDPIVATADMHLRVLESSRCR